MDSDKNHVTYSTCYSEGNTGLIYYTYRHYAPRLHKWINKDPIAERGGINLYQMVSNQPINYWDLLGHAYSSCHIYIFVGHTFAEEDPEDPGSIRLLAGTPMTLTIENAIGEAISNRALNPNNVAFGVVSCFSREGNKLFRDGGFGFIDESHTSPSTENALDPKNPNSKTRGLNLQLQQAFEDAKKRRVTMCADKNACCSAVTIEIEWIGNSTGRNDLIYKTYLYFTPKTDTKKCIR